MSAAAAETAPQQSPFNKRTVFWGVLASLLAAAGFFLLATYAPDFRLGRQGGESPLSKSGVGYAGIAKLLELRGDEPTIERFSVDELSYNDGLLIVTISPQSDADLFAEIVKAREGLPTLFVLPKWQTIPLQGHEGWEQRVQPLPPYEVSRWLAQIGEYKLATNKPAAGDLHFAGTSFKQPDDVRTIDAPNGLVSAGPRNAVLLQDRDRGFAVLADPDLLNNQALKDPARAKAALGIIDALTPEDSGVAFDLTLLAGARKHDMFKLLVEPPFLALTLSVLAAAALAFFHGLGRFGPAQPDVRAIPFGKRALVDTTANLLRRAGRLDEMGGRYATLMRNRAGALLGAPHGLQGEPLDQWLESLNKDSEDRYSALASAARSARTEADVEVSARRLHEWIARRIGERK